MTTKMTQQDVAEWILDILVKELGLKSGDEVPFQRLWLGYDGAKNTWHLTDLGYEYAA